MKFLSNITSGGSAKTTVSVVVRADDKAETVNDTFGYTYGIPVSYTHLDVTGIVYEPWHYRYVGKEYAQDIYKMCIRDRPQVLPDNSNTTPVSHDQPTTPDPEPEPDPEPIPELLTLVNPWNQVPEDWTVDLVTLPNGLEIDKRC